MKDALKKAVESFYDSRSVSGLAEEYARAIKFLQQQQWPGHVRELANVIRKALLLARRYPITEDIVRRAFEQMRPSRVGPQMPFAVHVANVLASAQAGERQNLLAELLEAVDRELYTQAIRRSDGDQTKVTRWLGVSRPTVRDKLTRYGIHPARDKD